MVSLSAPHLLPVAPAAPSRPPAQRVHQGRVAPAGPLALQAAPPRLFRTARAAAHQERPQGDGQRQEDEFSVTQFVSVFSGLVGSYLSSNAFSKQREASKKGASEADRDRNAKSARIVQQLGGSLLDAEAESPLFSLGPVPPCTEASNMRSRERHFTIITTAALPWLTGTSVNPLLRALYLAKSGRSVVLAIPWMELEDQKMVFPGNQTFSCKEDQEKVVLDWCRNRAKIDPATIPIRFVWYAAAYVKSVRSVFPVGDPSEELNADDPRDVLILEEPEHLSWYHKGNRWTEIFPHVVGIVHTNYQDYLVNYADTAQIQTSQFMPDSIKETAVFAASTLVCSAYCDVNIKLSDTIMPLPNEVTCNVHGVRQEFIAIGDSMGKNHLVDTAKSLLGGGEPKAEVVLAYYLGKAQYEKGWGELLDLLEEAGSRLEGLRIDGYGSGVDYERIIERAAAFKEDEAHLSMNPGRDHADKAIHKYGVLINPSTSDVLCTVTVEALAMGKHVVLARHPSNRFFQEYFASRSHFFNPGDVESFIEAVQEAIAVGPPQPLPEEERRELTWEAANERLFTSAEVRVLSGPYQRPSEASTSRLAYRLHNDMMSDKSLSEFLKEATLGNSTPWDTSLKNWRSEQLDKLESEVGLGSASPATTQQWERKLRESALELEKSVKQTLKDIVR